jgi:hypothetical protein
MSWLGRLRTGTQDSRHSSAAKAGGTTRSSGGRVEGGDGRSERKEMGKRGGNQIYLRSRCRYTGPDVVCVGGFEKWSGAPRESAERGAAVTFRTNPSRWSCKKAYRWDPRLSASVSLPWCQSSSIDLADMITPNSSHIHAHIRQPCQTLPGQGHGINRYQANRPNPP